jgi:hypothetical protein
MVGMPTALSTEKVRELLDAFEILQPSWTGSDGRTAARHRLCAPIIIAPLLSDKSSNSKAGGMECVGEPFAVLLHDLSDLGLGFLHILPLTLGDRFVLAEHPSFPISRVFGVVNASPVDDGRFRIGGQFDESFAEHERLRVELQRYVISRSILK